MCTKTLSKHIALPYRETGPWPGTRPGTTSDVVVSPFPTEQGAAHHTAVEGNTVRCGFCALSRGLPTAVSL